MGTMFCKAFNCKLNSLCFILTRANIVFRATTLFAYPFYESSKCRYLTNLPVYSHSKV